MASRAHSGRRGRRPLAAIAAAAAIAAVPAAAAGAPLSTVAGDGTGAASGDGGPATSARVWGPRGISWMPDGGFVLADFWNSRVRRVLSNGTITTLAGTGTNGNSADGIAAGSKLNNVHDVAALADGSVLIADESSERIRKIGTDGTLKTVAGIIGAKGATGDGGPATAAKINEPRGMAATSSGGFLIADSDNDRIRCVTPGGTITTVAGNGSQGFGGDGGSAKAATLDTPFDVAPTYDGGFLIADQGNKRVRYVSAAGVISTVAGNGTDPDAGDDGTPAPGDGGPATATPVHPWSVAALATGGFLAADSIADRVRQVLPNGTIATAAGTGAETSTDNADAAQGSMWGPRGLATRPDGAGFLIAEFGPPTDPDLNGGNRVRLVGGGLFSAFTLPAFPNTCSYPPPPAAPGGGTGTKPPSGGSATTPPPVKLVLRMSKRLRARHGRAFTIRYRVSRKARVSFEIRRNGKRVLRLTRGAVKGLNKLKISRRLRVGGYRMLAAARDSDNVTATAKARLAVRRHP